MHTSYGFVHTICEVYAKLLQVCSSMQYISRCQKEKNYPRTLKVYLKPSIRDHIKKLLKKQHERLQSLSLRIILDVLRFYTLSYRNTKELDTRLHNEEREEINTSLTKNDKHLQQINLFINKFNYLKFKPIRIVSEITETER